MTTIAEKMHAFATAGVASHSPEDIWQADCLPTITALARAKQFACVLNVPRDKLVAVIALAEADGFIVSTINDTTMKVTW